MKELHDALDLVIQAGNTKKGSFALEVNSTLQSAIFIHHHDNFKDTHMIFTYFDSSLSDSSTGKTVPFHDFTKSITQYIKNC